MAKNYIALENTSQTIKDLITELGGSVGALGAEFVGTQPDATGGTTTTGTLMAKSNAILTDTATLKNNQTSLYNGLRDLATQIIGADPTATGGSTITGNVIAKENAILSNIGESTDSETTDTLYGKTNCIINKEDNLKMLGLTTDGKVDNILSAVGSTSDTGGTATAGSLYAKLNTLLVSSSGGTSIIRNIQRGQLTTGSSANVTLSGFTDINKMIVILTGWVGGIFNINGTRYYSNFPLIINSLTTTNLVVSYQSESGVSITLRSHAIHYQVIEFY